MSELTTEQLAAAETMSMDELRAAALKEAAGETVEPVVAVTTSDPATTQARDANGRFSQADVIENKDAVDADPDPDPEPETVIYRKEIQNGNGSVDVYEAESLEELVEKLAEGKLNANKKIQEFIAERRTQDAQTEQVTKDDEFMIQEKLKTNPKSTIKEVVSEVIEERLNREQRSKDAQSRFVNTHPDYVPDPANGHRLAAWLQTHGYTEITSEGLEKAYQDLKHSGLLVLQVEGASATTEAKTATTQQTVEPAADATQSRSPKRSSTLSTRSGSRTTAPANIAPTEDELYKMPMDKLKDLANKQLADANRNE